MSGLLALLDDIAAIAKLAAAQVDDIAAQAAKAGSKSVGVVVDDAAVTPKYVSGLPASRELPIVAKIALGSLVNKLVILLPLLLLLDVVAPWTIPPLLILGGGYLCFEGAEKIWQAITHTREAGAQTAQTLDAAHIEKERVAGAIKTDLILSAEIMTIALASIDADTLWMRAMALAIVALLMTVLVYGAVALLVKIDDIGLRLAETGGPSITRAFGRGLVVAMPSLLKAIAVVGTAAMLWVGGGIVIHSLHELHVSLPYETVEAFATSLSGNGSSGSLAWIATAISNAIIGLVLGTLLMPAVKVLLMPFAILFPEKKNVA